ncbi:uncharacterized protein LOC141588101 [Silene latifolia]|uniref:uncharacterized protein LOC141588101 n=1 Tax=Silene latifolia TaxID=37657 RepID=UPI003D785EEB
MKLRYQGPWGVCGDFNCVLNFNERIGREVSWADIAEFRDCVTVCGLMDIKGQGAFFTWNNKHAPSSRGFSRIDRFLVNDEWMDLYPDAYVHFLPEGLFDHNPCVYYRRNSGVQRKRQFKYYNMWSLYPEFKNVVHNSWNVYIPGTPMYQVVTKLKNLKGPLKLLNRNGFSDVEKSVGVARALLEDIQVQMHLNPTDPALLTAESAAAKSYRHLSKIQHSFLSQKAKSTDGVIHSNLDKIEATFLHYYKNLLRSSLPTTAVDEPTVRQGKLVTQDHCFILLAEVTDVEIKECLFSLSSMKSPGPDGYSSQVFKDSWEVVGGDVITAIKNFFQAGKLLKQVNTTNITLIPKSSNPTSVLDFRPIACCNTLYKTLAKVLCKRLSKILPDIVSESQGGFIQGRNIVENVLICQDLKFTDLVMTCVTSPRYSLNINGNKFGFFKGNETSIMWILRAFSTFSSASGLCLNRSKSDIYFNGVKYGIVEDILQIFGFHRGSLPFKYLGVRISSKKLTKKEGLKLTDRIVARSRGWGTKHLTYAGRNFIWRGTSGYKISPNVKWDTCCLPKEEGGLGIKDAKTWNKALLGKYVWWLANKKDYLWVRWVSHVYMKNIPWTEYMAPTDCSWPWKKFL